MRIEPIRANVARSGPHKARRKKGESVSTAKSWDPSYEWKAVLTLSLAFGLVGLDRFILPPLFPAMMKDLDLNYQDLGNLVGALGIAWGVSAIVIGGLSDRLGRRRVLVPAVVLFSLWCCSRCCRCSAVWLRGSSACFLCAPSWASPRAPSHRLA